MPDLRPDWVCETTSPEKRRYDAVEKRLHYAPRFAPFDLAQIPRTRLFPR